MILNRAIDYDVVVAPTIPELRAKVKQAIAEGWQPDRGFSVFPSAALQAGSFVNASIIAVTFAQAIVKYEGEQP